MKKLELLKLRKRRDCFLRVDRSAGIDEEAEYRKGKLPAHKRREMDRFNRQIDDVEKELQTLEREYRERTPLGKSRSKREEILEQEEVEE